MRLVIVSAIVVCFVVGIGVMVFLPSRLPTRDPSEPRPFSLLTPTPAVESPMDLSDPIKKITTGFGDIYYMVRGHIVENAVNSGGMITTTFVLDGDQTQSPIPISIDPTLTGLAIHATSLADDVDSRQSTKEEFMRVLAKGKPVAFLVFVGDEQSNSPLRIAIENAAIGKTSFLSHIVLSPRAVDIVQ